MVAITEVVMVCAIFALAVGLLPYDTVVCYSLVTLPYERGNVSLVPMFLGVWVSMLNPVMEGWSVVGSSLAAMYGVHYQNAERNPVFAIKKQ